MRFKLIFKLLILGCVALATFVPGFVAAADQAAPAAAQTPEQLEQLVAPIALYPDQLVAQILAASTFPAQIVEANRWMQAHPNLKGQALAEAVNKQPWDSSVKALTQFPSVLANMNKNLSWTSSLGEAYVENQQSVIQAVQTMRQRAEAAGNLQSTPQQTVQTEGPNIVIQPANPEVVYVPQYDPWLVYGGVLPVWPGWYPYPGLYLTGPGIGFGLGFGVGLFAGYGWGWPHWGFDWGHRTVIFNHRSYVSNRASFVHQRNSLATHNMLVNHQGFANRETSAARHTAGTHAATVGHHAAAAHTGSANRSAFGAGSGFGGAHAGGFHGGGFHGGGFQGGGFHGLGFHGGGFHGGGFHGGGFHGGGFHGGGGRR